MLMVASSASTDKRPDASAGGAGRSRPSLRGVLEADLDSDNTPAGAGQRDSPGGADSRVNADGVGNPGIRPAVHRRPVLSFRISALVAWDTVATAMIRLVLPTAIAGRERRGKHP